MLNGGASEMESFSDYFSGTLGSMFGNMLVKEAKKKKNKRDIVKWHKNRATRALKKAQRLNDEASWGKYHGEKAEWKQARMKAWEEKREKENEEIMSILGEKDMSALWRKVKGAIGKKKGGMGESISGNK